MGIKKNGKNKTQPDTYIGNDTVGDTLSDNDSQNGYVFRRLSG